MSIKIRTANDKQFQAVVAFYKTLGFLGYRGSTFSFEWDGHLDSVLLLTEDGKPTIYRSTWKQGYPDTVELDLTALEPKTTTRLPLNSEYTAVYTKGDDFVRVNNEKISVVAVLAVAKELA